MKKSLLIVSLMLSLCLAAGVFLAGCSDLAGSDSGRGDVTSVLSPEEMGLEEATVVRVVDGDTFKVRVDGEEVYVRLIGIDTPESVASDESRNTEEGVTAAEFTKTFVGPGQVVWLQRDVSDVDQYDRLLRYMWLEVPADPYDEYEIATKMLNAILVIDGYAQSKLYKPDTTLYDLFEEFEDYAIAEGNGVSYMWS